MPHSLCMEQQILNDLFLHTDSLAKAQPTEREARTFFPLKAKLLLAKGATDLYIFFRGLQNFNMQNRCRKTKALINNCKTCQKTDNDTPAITTDPNWIVLSKFPIQLCCLSGVTCSQ